LSSFSKLPASAKAPPRMWEVVGGADKGGILVRQGEDVSAPKAADRLSTGALIKEVELKGDRLHYSLVTGTGPSEGWISIRITGKELAVRTDKQPPGAPWVPDGPMPAGAGELPPDGPPALGPSGVPRKLMPACEVSQRFRAQERRLEALVPCPDRKEFFRRAALRLKGDLFGLPFPATPEEFVLSPEYGPGWLTEAFHRAGTMAEDNRVARITWWRRFEGGGSGPKCLFTVEYEKPDESLDTKLFMKQPWTLEENKMQRYMEEGQCRFGDVHGGEINFYQWVSPYVPFSVPKYYFGDISRESTESCLINAAADWPTPGKESFGPYELYPPCEKCEDWRLTDPHEYYFAMMRRLGALAGLEKTGKLGPEVATVPWSWYGPSPQKRDPGMTKYFRQFVDEVAPHIWPKKVQSKTFLDHFEKHMDMVASASQLISQFTYADPLYVGFGHANGNTDNAYFYRNAEGVMECGMLDWGQSGYMAYAQEFLMAFGSCLGEMLAEYDDRLVRAFADAYHETGAPPLDAEELIVHFRLTNASSTGSLLGMALPWLSEKHPQGRPFWKAVKAYNDQPIISNFGLKFGVSMLYNKVLLWSLREDAYWATLEQWGKRVGIA